MCYQFQPVELEKSGFETKERQHIKQMMKKFPLTVMMDKYGDSITMTFDLKKQRIVKILLPQIV